MMMIWRLTPTDVESDDWNGSTYKGEVIARAKDEQQARALAIMAEAARAGQGGHPGDGKGRDTITVSDEQSTVTNGGYSWRKESDWTRFDRLMHRVLGERLPYSELTNGKKR